MNDKILRPKVQAQFLGVSEVTLWRFSKLPDFPKAIRLGVNSVGRLESELLAWLRSRQGV